MGGAFCPGWAHIRFLPTPCASAYISLARPPFSVSAPSLPPLSPSIAIQFHFPPEVSVQMGRLGSVQANRRRPMLKEHLVCYAIQASPTRPGNHFKKHLVCYSVRLPKACTFSKDQVIFPIPVSLFCFPTRSFSPSSLQVPTLSKPRHDRKDRLG